MSRTLSLTRKISMRSFGTGMIWDGKKAFQDFVQREDEIRYARRYRHAHIPKDMKYPVSNKWRETPLKAFLSSILP